MSGSETDNSNLSASIRINLGRYARWYWTKLRRADQPKTFTVNGRRITIRHSGSVAHRNAIKQCFVHRQYELPTPGVNYRQKVLAHYEAIVSKGSIPLIVDAGANIGASALWHAATYPAAHVVAVEPATDNVEMLRKNCGAAAFEIRAAAIGPRDGFTYLTDPGIGADAYRTSDLADHGYQVPVVSVETILRDKPSPKYEPFILKVDIEGAEKALFTGSCTAIDRFPLVTMEPHDWLMPGQHTALGFFQFHLENMRDFSYHMENIFSIAYSRLVDATSGGGAGTSHKPLN